MKIHWNVNDPTKIKWYIESIPQKCINLIIKKKLISSERINKYNNIVNQNNKKNQENPKEILFNIFSIVGIIESANKAVLSSNKLNLL